MGMLLRFGVPSLDLLLGKKPDAGDSSMVSDFGVWLPKSDVATSFAIIGPDGTGKSVLALHLASRYSADNNGANKALYISTDLTYPKAAQMWENFALDRPHKRQIPFAVDFESDEPTADAGWRYPNSPASKNVGLEWYTPGATLAAGGAASQPIEDYLQAASEWSIAFTDLASVSAGDDWGFLCRLLASLDTPKPGAPRHLLVVDAIEGFEMFDGDRNAFGQRLSRRSRVSQIMRLAEGKCHTVLVVEETRPGERGPEEFVTDVVIRLRNRRVRGYNRRTVEVEKVRGQSHVRGEHAYTIRKGEGSTTFDQSNHDDPRVANGQSSQGYILVFPSVHCQSREFMVRRPDGRSTFISDRHSKLPPAGFGIPFLDDLLVASKDDAAPGDVTRKGIPFGSVAAVIGDHHTHKGRLGWSFLSSEFHELVRQASQFAADPSLLLETWNNRREWPAFKDCGGVVLITSDDTSREHLAEEFASWFLKELRFPPMFRNPLREALKERITCRRLEIHDISSSILLHIVDQAVNGTRRAVRELGGNPEKIRVVLDDFSNFKEIYPDIRKESLFLPALLFRLRRAGVSSLIIDTHSGRPDSPIADPFDNELRALVNYRLYTWRVPFFGESRIAIAPIPPLSSSQGLLSEMQAVVRELRWTQDEARPQVDPHFELYTGLEEGRPQPVPLEIRLYEETPAFADYLKKENAVWRSLFVPANGQSVLFGVPAEDYTALHDFAVLQQDTRLDHTLVIQVDDFWSFRRRDSLRDRSKYLLRDVTWKEGKPDATVDPFGVFRPGGAAAKSGSYRRCDGFRVSGYELDDSQNAEIDRVPFVWDFGFLLCRRPYWEACANVEIPRWKGSGDKESWTVGRVWKGLPKAFAHRPELLPHKDEVDDGSESGTGDSVGPRESRPSWRLFLGACETVAQRQNDAVPFDLATISAESFSCMMLEIWFSEIIMRLHRSEATWSTRILIENVRGVGTKHWRPAKRGLIWAVGMYGFELYRAWLLLVDALQLDTTVNPKDAFEFPTRLADPRAVASRHWYKTACARDESMRDVVAVGLPGHCSVRGDWFLAVAGNSRSVRLADRACDLLNTRRANYARLQLGIGLPTRDVVDDPARDADLIRTALRASTPEGTQGYVSYGDLRRIGETPTGDFQWLWRSELRDYDLHARLWQKWLHRVALAWNERRIARAKLPWVGGFTIYDNIDQFGWGRKRLLRKRDYSSGMWNPGEEIDLTSWKKRYPVSHGQFLSSWRAFEQLCNTFVRLAEQARSGTQS